MSHPPSCAYIALVVYQFELVIRSWFEVVVQASRLSCLGIASILSCFDITFNQIRGHCQCLVVNAVGCTYDVELISGPVWSIMELTWAHAGLML